MRYSYFTIAHNEAEETGERTYINIEVDDDLFAVLEIDNFATSGFRLNRVFPGVENVRDLEAILTEAFGHPAPWTMKDLGTGIVWAEEGTVAHLVYNILYNF